MEMGFSYIGKLRGTVCELDISERTENKSMAGLMGAGQAPDCLLWMAGSECSAQVSLLLLGSSRPAYFSLAPSSLGAARDVLVYNQRNSHAEF